MRRPPPGAAFRFYSGNGTAFPCAMRNFHRGGQRTRARARFDLADLNSRLELSSRARGPGRGPGAASYRPRPVENMALRVSNSKNNTVGRAALLC